MGIHGGPAFPRPREASGSYPDRNIISDRGTFRQLSRVTGGFAGGGETESAPQEAPGWRFGQCRACRECVLAWGPAFVPGTSQQPFLETSSSTQKKACKTCTATETQEEQEVPPCGLFPDASMEDFEAYTGQGSASLRPCPVSFPMGRGAPPRHPPSSPRAYSAHSRAGAGRTRAASRRSVAAAATAPAARVPPIGVSSSSQRP